MHRPSKTRPNDGWFLLLLICLLIVSTRPLRAADGDQGRQLQLEVSINGQPTKLIAAFADVKGQGLVTTRSELAELFIRAPGDGAPGDSVRLTSIPGLTYELDEAAQRVNLIAGDAIRMRRTYDAASRDVAPTAGKADYGLVANYNVFSAASQKFKSTYAPEFTGTNVLLDSRFITPYGVLNHSTVLGSNVTAQTDTLRLDTYAMRVDPESLKTYRAGDVITGGLAWTQPIRIGGAQVQHDYVFRPDLVTASLPSVSGSAAVPSTVDVYINNVKSVSQQVGAGPYTISNLPAMSGAGDARVVVRDVSGRETQTSLSFFSSPRVLREGIYESSVEVGVPRLRYGILSDDYESQVVGAGTLRLGVADWLTVETHGEGGLGLINGGAGVVAKVGRIGVVNAAVSGSTGHGKQGAQTYASLDTKAGPVSIRVNSQRALGGYEDLAAASARLRPSVYGVSTGLGGTTGGLLASRQIRSLDGVSFSVPLEFDRSSVSASYLQAKSDDGQVSRIASVSYSRPLFVDATFHATAFHDFAEAKGTGVYLGISMPLGRTRAGPLVGSEAVASVGMQNTAQGHSLTTDVSNASDNSVGAWGWRVRDSEGTKAQREATITYRSPIARVGATVGQQGDGVLSRFQADGAVVAMGDNIYFANRIDDGFGVVSTGAPNVRVTKDGRYVGQTGDDGKLLVPNLRSHHGNRIGIDATDLPIDADVDATSQKATPAFRSGVSVDFAVNTSVPSAILTLKRPDGSYVAAGSELTLTGDAAPYVVGYDGQVFLKKLGPNNSVTVKLADGGSCTAAFAYVFKRGQQSSIGPFRCE